MTVMNPRKPRQHNLPTVTNVDIKNRSIVPIKQDNDEMIEFEGRQLTPEQWDKFLAMELTARAHTLTFTDAQADHLIKILVNQYPCPMGQVGNHVCYKTGGWIKRLFRNRIR